MDLEIRLFQSKVHTDSSQLTTCPMDDHRATQELSQVPDRND
uniref:Uncharacterized protein n=1 Tax=Arundo donax TaxID=35708 RepID=A0A0A9G7E8_ARUDO